MHEVVARVNCASLLSALESELKRRDQWAKAPPAAERMDSTLPFAVDKLALEEWLQFVFIPRLRQILDAGMALPRGAGLAPYAEVVFRDDLDAAAGLLALLRELDRTLSGVSH